MPTMDHDDEDIEKMYNDINDILQQEGTGQVIAIVIGDFSDIMVEG